MIDLDIVAEDVEALAKLYECATLMVQSGKSEESSLGYRMLDVVGEVMRRQEQQAWSDKAALTQDSGTPEDAA